MIVSPPKCILPAVALAVFLPLTAWGQQPKVDVLRIGATGTLTGDADSAKEKTALDTLHKFIKDETGMENEIVREKSWQDLADKLVKGQLHLGVFQGYEFAWAQGKHADLKPLALGVNVYTYPAAYVMALRDSPARDFAGLQGQSLALPVTSQGFLRLFVDRQSEAKGKTAETFFAKITASDNVEDALDDVVDGKVQAVAIDQAALEGYKRRKPGRFNRLKVIAQSQPFPPVVVAYYGSTLDEATRQRFKERLLAAHRKEKGETLLTLSKLSSFKTVPDDFAQVIAATRKAYPPPEAKSK